MSQLPTPHSDVHAEFMQGRFSVQLSFNNPFGRIPVDHTIEETVNKINIMLDIGERATELMFPV